MPRLLPRSSPRTSFPFPAGKVSHALLLLGLLIANLVVLPRSSWAHWWWRGCDCHYFIEESTIEVSLGWPSWQDEGKREVLEDYSTNTDVTLVEVPWYSDNDIAMYSPRTVRWNIFGFEYRTKGYGITGWWGLALTEDLDPDNDYCGTIPNWAEINHGHALFNWYYGTGGGTTGTDSDFRGVFCQEVGHLLGLGHCCDESDCEDPGDCPSSCGCLAKGYCPCSSPSSSGRNTLGTHEISHINSFY